MKKDHLRDYATNAFRTYASVGSPTYEEMRQRILDDIINRSAERDLTGGGVARPTEAMILAAEEQLDRSAGKLADILAVIRTVDRIKAHKDGDMILRSLREVYFVHPFRSPEKGEISARVRAVASRNFTDERTVYRWLSAARDIFSVERGLNIEKVVSSST